MTGSAIMVTAVTLAELADTANREHAAAEEAARSWLEHAVTIGEVLLEAKRQVPHGEWTMWIEDNVRFSRAAANLYIRVATYKDLAAASPSTTREEVGKYLRGLPALSHDVGCPEKFDEAKALLESGLTQTEAAEVLGVSQTTIGRWTDPRLRQRSRAHSKERQRGIREARKALAEKESRQARDAAVKRAGGAVSHAYANLRKTASALQVAIDEADDRTIEVSMRAALEHVYKAEDEIVQALGVHNG